MSGIRWWLTESHKVMGLVRLLNMVSSPLFDIKAFLTISTAEFKGPGVHHHFEEEDDYGMDHDHRSHMLTSRGGRVILLGNAGQFQTHSVDEDMFVQSDEEEKDLESQVQKGQADGADSDRNMREETPGPEYQSSSHIEHSDAEPNLSAATDGPAKDS